MRPIIALFLLASCNPLPKTVTMEGEVSDAQGLGGLALPGAELTVRDEEGTTYASATTNGAGEFSVEVPAGELIFAIVTSDAGPPTSFSGVTGLSEVYEVEDGEIFAFSHAQETDWRARFEGCPSTSAKGAGALFGEVRVQDVTDAETGEHPLAVTGRVELWNPRTEAVYLPCYLDAEEGAVFDGTALYTGIAGAFAFVGVPEGVYVLSGVLEVNPDDLFWSDQFVYVPKSGVVPRFPLWVSFPI
ncbi:MAG: hypothetical protein GWP91_15840 [Rhodobacterales bacterium]|nr:hypothetical protein [Rhodobacterales bacterium]